LSLAIASGVGCVGYAFYTFKKIKDEEEELQVEKEGRDGTWVFKVGDAHASHGH
jgi:hypothetical protein